MSANPWVIPPGRASPRMAAARLHNEQEIERLLETITFDIRIAALITLDGMKINYTEALANSAVSGKEGDTHFVGFSSPYAHYVEFGIPGGHRANFDAIRGWVAGKLKITGEEEQLDVASRVWQKIFKKGIKPTRFFKKAIKAVIAGKGTIYVPKRAKSSGGKKRRKKSRLQKFMASARKRFARAKKKFAKARRNIRKAAKRGVKKTIRNIRRTTRATNKFNRAVSKYTR